MSPVLLVTGGLGRGIGAATSRLAAAQGYAVCVNYARDAAAADAVVDGFRHAGGKAIAVAANVAKEAEVVGLFETLDRKLGRVDVLVNNAGILSKASRLQAMDAERFARSSPSMSSAACCAHAKR